MNTNSRTVRLPNPRLPLNRRLSQLERLLGLFKFTVRPRVLIGLSRPELSILSACSKFLQATVNEYITIVWNHDEFLGAWFRHTLTFRGILARTGALMTGSQVLRFFDRQKPDTSCDLDILTRVAGMPILTSFLEAEGYERQPRKMNASGEEYPLLGEVFGITSNNDFRKGGGKSGIMSIMDFTRTRNRRGRNKHRPIHLKVQVIAVAQSPAEHIIMSFHSTGVMNYMSHSEAVSVFPKQTFIERVFYVSSREPLGKDWNPGWAKKYTARGFKVDTHRSYPTLDMGKRSCSDDRCWIIPFKETDKARQYVEKAYSKSFYPHMIPGEVEFDVIWLTEAKIGQEPRRFRMSVHEPESWYYVWPMFST